ncbi:peptide-methionine (S)-S-oxide reductase MsrA [Aurantibacter sp.]|uniref:peptide-methionine (S)-S-oxide reductase MsrA n=1 Tax=Aurantibacter sp. TaxID=2807103 RepID=UPI0035C81A69
MENENLEVATFAGGCFWCTEAVFNTIEGVELVVSGFTGGQIKNPAYREIISGRTGHAEAVQVFFNPNKASFVTLLEVFFATHNPTTLNQQGYDIGTQYRSEIFYSNKIQQQQTLEFIELLESQNVFEDTIVTKVSKLDVFYNAEEEHQDFYNNNKEYRYCQLVIQPKLDKIKQYYSNLLKT